MTHEQLLTAVLLTPWVGVILIALANRLPNLRELFSLLTAGSLFWFVLQLAIVSDGGVKAETLRLLEFAPGISIAFRLEPLGLLFLLIASGLWIINTLYSIGYMRGNNEQHQTRFYICFAIAIGSTMGLALSANLFTLFLCYEVLTLSTFPLVAHKGTDEARKSGRVYLGYLLFTSIGFLLFAILWTWQLAGTLDFKTGGILAQKADPVTLSVLLCLYIFGIGKAAILPVHRWLPAAMVAPTPVSALLHAVAVVKAGVFTVLKVVLYVFSPELLKTVPATQWLVYLAGTTIILGSVFALLQTNLKKRLAYSTVSQLSYVTMAALILHPLTLIAAAMHIAVHALGKITLFFAAGSIYTAHHKTEIRDLDGIGRLMPFTMIAFTIGAISMIGLPITAGFLSKWYLAIGSFKAHEWFALSVIVLSTLLKASYFLPIVQAAFFKTSGRNNEGIREAPVTIVVALSLTALMTLILFFMVDDLFALVEKLPVGISSGGTG